MVALTLVLAVPAQAGTGHEYRKCSSKSVCPYFVVTNSKATKLVRLWVSPKCSDARASFTGNYNQPVTVNSKGKFSITYRYSSYESGPRLEGDIKVNGKVTKKDKVSLTYQVLGEVKPGCKNLLGKKTVSLKYLGAKSGY